MTGKSTEDDLNQAVSSRKQVNSQYYRGGFDAKMNRREASLILGVSPTAAKNKVREAHRRIMLLNHPDRGNYLVRSRRCKACFSM